MIERILVPLDGSARAEAALGLAMTIPGARYDVLVVVPDAAFVLPIDARRYDRVRSDQENAARDYVHRLLERLGAEAASVEWTVVTGDPSAEILKSSNRYDLVVMSTSGRGAGGRALHGSVADRVARHGEAPVLLVRVGVDPGVVPEVTRILVPLDGSELSQQALGLAKSLAVQLDVPTVLIRVLDVDGVRRALDARGSPMARYAQSVDTVRAAYETYLQDRAAEFAGQGPPVSYDVLEGEPADAIEQVSVPGDLVVMTTHGRGGVSRWLLGSVAEHVVRHDDAPILLMHPIKP